VGWGAALPLYFDLEKVNVENWAMGGMRAALIITPRPMEKGSGQPQTG
jgi:hypothetical protein